ncbi:MAG: SurA N-terminal domain-containing protein [Maricaulaceae bacterium]|nr:SurA N-terminal domain-containing protein [Maricaulaceae bacterium]
MLTLLRNMAKSPWFLIVIALLIASFALWGVTDVFRGGGNAVVVVGNERVLVSDLSDGFDRALREVQAENPGYTREQAISDGLADRVIDQLIVNAYIMAKARELGMTIPEGRVVREIAGIPAFQDPVTGRFDRGAYALFLSRQRVNEAQFERRIREELLRQQLVSPLFTGIRAPQALLTIRNQYSGERRDLRALVLPAAAAGDPGEPDDEQLQALIEANREAFTEPERRAFTLVRFTVDSFTADVQVDEDDIRDAYEYEVETGQIGTPATRSFAEIAFADEASAEAAAERLRGGETPDAVAESLGADAPFRAADRRIEQIPDNALADALFAMNAGEAAAVRGRIGWYAVLVEAAQEAQTPTFAERRAELMRSLSRDAAEDRMHDAMAAFERARNIGATLEEAAAEAGTFYEVFSPVANYGQRSDGLFAFTLLGQQELMRAIFSQIQGHDSELTPYGEGDYFTLRVDAVEPERLVDLEEVRDDARTLWRMRQIDERLQELAVEAMERLRGGESMDAVAADIAPGARVEVASLTRSETAGPFSQEVVSAAFMIQPGDYRAARGGERSRVVVAVDAITPAGEPAAARRIELREALNEELIGDFDATLLAAMQAEYPPRVDRRLRDIALGVADPADPTPW